MPYVETDPNWTPGGYVVPASEMGAPVQSINLAPVPQQAATLQEAAGRNVPMVRRNGAVQPAPPILNNGNPTQVAWSIDPVNGSVSPLVGAYSAYPHVVYAPERIGADRLLQTIYAGLANVPFLQQAAALQQASAGGRAAAPRGTTGGTQRQTQRRSAPVAPRNVDETDVITYAPWAGRNDGPYDDGMLLVTPEEPVVLDSAPNGHVADVDTLRSASTPVETGMAVGTGLTGAALGGEAARRVLAARKASQIIMPPKIIDAAMRAGVVSAEDAAAISRAAPEALQQAMATGRSLIARYGLAAARTMAAAMGNPILLLGLAAQQAIDYGVSQGMDVTDWNSSDDMDVNPDSLLDLR